MAKVFVSHAYADRDFVTPFVDNVLRIGMGLNGQQLFYSSERDTGVRSGADLLHDVRREVESSTLVIAIITPMYQTRPVCVAELGAAWGRADPDFVFPMLAPGMQHSELEGVLSVMTAFPIDDNSALDELSDRIERNYASVTNTQWGVGKRKWLNAVGAAAATLKIPDVPTAEEHQALVDERDELAAALQYTDGQVDEVRQKYERLKASKTKDPATVRKIDVGDAPLARFNAAVSDVRAAFREVPSPVREAIYRSLSGDLAPFPNAFDDRAVQEFNDAIDRQLITEPHDDAMYGPNLNKPRVAAALRAVQHLQAQLGSGEDEAFDEWFAAEYPTSWPTSPIVTAGTSCWHSLRAPSTGSAETGGPEMSVPGTDVVERSDRTFRTRRRLSLGPKLSRPLPPPPRPSREPRSTPIRTPRCGPGGQSLRA